MGRIFRSQPRIVIAIGAGEIVVKHQMLYKALLGKTLYNEWMESFVATEANFETK